MDIKRVLTGVIGFPIIAAILILSNTYVFDGIVAIIALISVHEFYNSFITTKKSKTCNISWLHFLYRNSFNTYNTKRIFIINSNIINTSSCSNIILRKHF